MSLLSCTSLTNFDRHYIILNAKLILKTSRSPDDIITMNAFLHMYLKLHFSSSLILPLFSLFAVISPGG